MDLTRILEKIRAISQTGLAYTKDHFDRERYEKLGILCTDLVAALTNQPRELVVEKLPLEKGYATPKVDVRAAIFQGSKIVLCQERSDGKWTLPGGWADIGESPAESAIKEVFEETGYEVRPLKLIALFDRDKHEHPKMLHHVYKAFFLCELIRGSPTASNETSDIGFFDLNDLPELSLARVTAAQIARCFEHWKNPELPTDFD